MIINKKLLRKLIMEVIKEELLSEGGNVFKTTDGTPATIRIKREDVDPTLQWLEGILGINLVDFKLGTTGKKETSGDLDLAVDENAVTKEELINKLRIWLDQNHPGDNIRQWVAKTGTSVHFKTPIRGDEANGFVQTDLMFGNPDFMLWSVKGEPEGSEYRGRDRQLLINAIATQRGFAWSTFFGLKDRSTGERFTEPQEIVQKVLGPGYGPEDFDSIYTLFDIISDKEKYPDDVYEAIREKAGFEFPHRDEVLSEAKKIEPRIQHAEDLIFFEGSAGAMRAVNALEKMNDPENRPETSVKWDGSPAIIFGRDETGKFVFTDKSGFGAKGYNGKASNPEEIAAMYWARAENAALKSDLSVEEIYQQRYSDITPQMQKALDLTERSVDPNHRGYFFGEVLYFDKPQVEDGKFVFKPNMIKYKVDVNSEMGKKIADSEIGIVLHLKKDVQTLDNQPLDFEGLNPVPGALFFGKTFIEKPIAVDNSEVQFVKQLISTNSIKIDNFFDSEKLKKLAISDLPAMFYTYLNSKVDTGLNNLGTDFIEWLQSKENISPRKKQNAESYITENKESFEIIWKIVSKTMKIKDDIIGNIDTQGGLPFSQSLGDEEVGEGYVLSSDGNLIKLVDRSKFTRANRSVVREQEEINDEVGDFDTAETHIFIPGGFKPPHKGHLSLLLKAVERYPNSIIHITSGPTTRSSGELEISAEQAKQVWEKYIQRYGVDNQVDLDYFETFKTNRVKKDGTPIFSSSPFIRIGLRMENELDPNSNIVVVSSEDEHINFVKNAVTYLNDKKGKSFTFDSIQPSTIDSVAGGKISATDMRNSIANNDFESFKEFIPDDLSEEDSLEIFELLGGNKELNSLNESVKFIMETIDKALNILLLTEKVRKTPSKKEWCVYSKSGNRKFGCYPSREKAVKRLRQVEYFKNMPEEQMLEKVDIIEEMSSMAGGNVQGYAGGNKNKMSLIREED